MTTSDPMGEPRSGLRSPIPRTLLQEIVLIDHPPQAALKQQYLLGFSRVTVTP